MKIFKLLSMVLIAIFISISFTACSNDKESVVPPVEDEYIDVPLQISIDTSIDITDEPLSRADNQNPVYAIDIEEIDSNTSTTTDYAYGFFRSLDNVTIKLKKNKEYRIYAALYYDFFSKYKFYSNDGFNLATFYNTYTNGFIYPYDEYYNVSYWYNKDYVPYSETYLIEGDGYYDTIDKFSPSLNNICSMELKRITSAFEISVEGLTEGSIRCGLEFLEYNLIPSKPKISQMFVCSYLMYNTECNLKVYVDYIPTTGEPIKLVNSNYTFKRNKRKRFLIKLDHSGESENVNTGFNFTQEKVEFIDEEQIRYNCTIN